MPAEALDLMAVYMDDIKRYTELPHKEVMELIERAQAGDQAARQRVILHNLRLVKDVAFKATNARSFTTRMDAIQDGYFGLCAAIAGFDTSLGFRFSTYAVRSIRSYIRRATITTETTIHCPEYLYTAWRKQVREAQAEGRESPRHPTMATSIHGSTRSQQYGDMPVEGDLTMVDERPANEVAHVEAHDELERIVAAADLTGMERVVIAKRYWGDLPRWQVGKDLGMSIKKVSDIEHAALAKMRAAASRLAASSQLSA
jgi:RNA polymerase sigma factor (sigma-70 family)